MWPPPGAAVAGSCSALVALERAILCWDLAKPTAVAATGSPPPTVSHREGSADFVLAVRGAWLLLAASLGFKSDCAWPRLRVCALCTFCMAPWRALVGAAAPFRLVREARPRCCAPEAANVHGGRADLVCVACCSRHTAGPWRLASTTTESGARNVDGAAWGHVANCGPHVSLRACSEKVLPQCGCSACAALRTASVTACLAFAQL